MGHCQDINKPEVDDSALPCEELLSADCVVTTQARGFLKVGIGDTITTVIRKISDAILSLKNNTIYLPTLPTYADDAAAGVGGLAAGKAYKKPTGEVMIKL